MGERFVTPDGGAFVVEVIVIVWLPLTAPGGMVIVPPWSVTVPPAGVTGRLTVAPVPTMGLCGLLELEQPHSGSTATLKRANTPYARRLRTFILCLSAAGLA